MLEMLAIISLGVEVGYVYFCHYPLIKELNLLQHDCEHITIPFLIIKMLVESELLEIHQKALRVQ